MPAGSLTVVRAAPHPSVRLLTSLDVRTDTLQNNWVVQPIWTSLILTISHQFAPDAFRIGYFVLEDLGGRMYEWE